MFKDLIKVANRLDKAGLSKEADLLDKLMSIIKVKLDAADGLDVTTEEVEEEMEEESEEISEKKEEDSSFQEDSVSVHKDASGKIHIQGRVSTSKDMDDFEERIKEMQEEIELKIEECGECDVEETLSNLSYETTLVCTPK